MNLREHEADGRFLYAELCVVVGELLECAFQSAQGFRLQQIQSCAKDPVSLRARLEQIDAIETDDIESVHKDLADGGSYFTQIMI